MHTLLRRKNDDIQILSNSRVQTQNCHCGFRFAIAFLHAYGLFSSQNTISFHKNHNSRMLNPFHRCELFSKPFLSENAPKIMPDFPFPNSAEKHSRWQRRRPIFINETHRLVRARIFILMAEPIEKRRAQPVAGARTGCG